MPQADKGPLVDRPLKVFSALLIRCRTCGKESRWHSRQLLNRGIWKATEIASLKGRMVCTDCNASGRPAREISVRPWPPIHQGFQQSGEQIQPATYQTGSSGLLLLEG